MKICESFLLVWLNTAQAFMWMYKISLWSKREFTVRKSFELFLSVNTTVQASLWALETWQLLRLNVWKSGFELMNSDKPNGSKSAEIPTRYVSKKILMKDYVRLTFRKEYEVFIFCSCCFAVCTQATWWNMRSPCLCLFAFLAYLNWALALTKVY